MWGTIAGSAIGALGSAAGQQAANSANALENQTVRDWETMMSNTAMVRRVDDLKNAGLNPILAVGQGGASTPGMSPIPMQNTMGQAGQIMAQTSAQVAQVQNTKADTALKQANAANVLATTPTPDSFTQDYNAGIASKEANAAYTQAQLPLIGAQIDKLKTDITANGINNANLQTLNALQNKLIQAQTAMSRMGVQTQMATLPAKLAEGDLGTLAQKGTTAVQDWINAASSWVENVSEKFQDWLDDAKNARAHSARAAW